MFWCVNIATWQYWISYIYVTSGSWTQTQIATVPPPSMPCQSLQHWSQRPSKWITGSHYDKCFTCGKPMSSHDTHQKYTLENYHQFWHHPIVYLWEIPLRIYNVIWTSSKKCSVHLWEKPLRNSVKDNNTGLFGAMLVYSEEGRRGIAWSITLSWNRYEAKLSVYSLHVTHNLSIHSIEEWTCWVFFEWRKSHNIRNQAADFCNGNTNGLGCSWKIRMCCTIFEDRVIPMEFELHCYLQTSKEPELRECYVVN